MVWSFKNFVTRLPCGAAAQAAEAFEKSGHRSHEITSARLFTGWQEDEKVFYVGYIVKGVFISPVCSYRCGRQS